MCTGHALPCLKTYIGFSGAERQTGHRLTSVKYTVYFVTKCIILTLIQVAKITGCQLVKHHRLPFNFEFGACGQFNNEILLCFSSDMVDNKKCRRFNGTELNVAESNYPKLPTQSNYHHQKIRLGNYLSRPFAAGGMENNVHVESYNFNTNKWKNLGRI